MKNIKDLLSEHPFFGDLQQADLEMIAQCGQIAHFREGETIFREGEQADTFYVIRKGRVALDTHAPPGGTMVVATLGKGEVVGWSWLFPPYKWHFDARAVSETSAIALDGACLRAKCEQDHDLGYRLMKRFAQIAHARLQAARIQLLDLYATPSSA